MESLIYPRGWAGSPAGGINDTETEMAIAGYIVAGIFALAIIIAILVHFGWSISTQHRDHGVEASGAIHRRLVWSRRPPRTHAGPANAEALPADPRTGEPVAAAPVDQPARQA